MMAYFNKVFLIGNLTDDPQLKETPHGTKVATFGFATHHTYRTADGIKEKEVCFVDIVVWDRLAETYAQYLKKGKQVFIEGRLHLSRWENDGQKRSKHEVHAKTVQFLSPPDAPSAGATDDT